MGGDVPAGRLHGIDNNILDPIKPVNPFSRIEAAVIAVAMVLLIGCMVQRPPTKPSAETVDLSSMPYPEREFRGVWIATVANIDWPSRPGLPVAQQQAELIALLDRAAALNMNAVVFQVRPAADALYASALEPWSEYLTGEMGKAPEPFYDPLAFAVEEAHRRGLELHAWFNPYRARHVSMKSPAAPNHVSHTHPDAVKRYGRYLWLDPGERVAEEQTVRVILDVVQRYDIDGVHLDDYFYPYKEKDSAGRILDFPDDASWSRAVAAGESRSRDDWRRSNVDRLMERLYREIKGTKPWVKFGISPFGIWRPGHPAQIKGLDAYSELYADARKWFVNGWVDYFSPQLYWKIDAPAQSYPVLLAWWQEQNRMGRHLWPGNFTSRIHSTEGQRWQADEIVNQIHLTRAQEGASGNIHFSMKALMENRDAIGDHLSDNLYALPALVPASPWLNPIPPPRPTLNLYHDPSAFNTTVEIQPAGGTTVAQWVVRARYGETWTMDIVPGQQQAYTFTGKPDVVAVSVVDRVGNEGPVGIEVTAEQPSVTPMAPDQQKTGW